MKTIIYLVRHGQTNWNKDHLIQGRIDISLNDEGRSQILATAKKLKAKNIKFDLFLSSPLQRAIESCEIIKNYLEDTNQEIIIRPNLIEREFGEADGLEISDKVYEKILLDDYNKMEKSTTISKRALDEILDISSIYPGKTILILTHSHFIKALFINLDNHITFKSTLLNGALNYIELEDGKITNFKFND